jgi:hypothetical protein
LVRAGPVGAGCPSYNITLNINRATTRVAPTIHTNRRGFMSTAGRFKWLAAVECNINQIIFKPSKRSRDMRAIVLRAVAVAALVLMTAGVAVADTYIIIKNSAGFIAVKGDDAVGAANAAIQNVINAVKTDAQGAACTIQFGNGRDTLDIGSSNITFDGGASGTDWGKVTLSGILKSSYSVTSALESGTIYLTNGVSIESAAEIETDGVIRAVTIYNKSTGIVTVNGGTVASISDFDWEQCYIDNDDYYGEYICDNIYRETVRELYSCGVYNASTGTVTITGGTVSASSNGDGESYGVYNNSTGMVTVSGGTVSSYSSYSSPSPSYGIYNESGTVIISGGTVSFSSRSSSIYYGIYNASGTITVSEGTVSSSGFASYGIYNVSGAVTISGGRNYYSPSSIYDNPPSGFYYNAIYNASTGTVTFNDGSAWSISGTAGTVTVNGGGVGSISGETITVTGGTVGDISGKTVTVTGGTTDKIDIENGTITVTGGEVYMIEAIRANVIVTGGTVTSSVYGSDITVTGGSIGSYVTTATGSVVLGGSPIIGGPITAGLGRVRVITTGDTVFAPADNIYALSVSEYLIDEVAVRGGAEFLSNFILYNATENRLGVGGNDLVIKYALTATPYTVSFSRSGGTGTAPASFSVLSGNKLPKIPTTGVIGPTGKISDGKWYTDSLGTTEFIFGTNGTAVTANITLYLKWVQNNGVLSFDRIIPNDNTGEVAVVAPVAALSGELAVGPNPVGKSSGGVVFFWNGKALSGGSLTVYDASGNVVRKLDIKDNTVTGNVSKRAVGSWDLKDASGRPVSEGTYLVRGKVVTFGGKGERAAVVVGVR